jgi:signal transduction histidine kinase
MASQLKGLPDMITADERKLKQVMYNLLSNAVKFTPDGGRIAVTARMCEIEDTPFSSADKNSGPFVEISVSDNGIGINPEDLNRIFNPFEQVETSSTKKFQGTGLGLSLTKNLRELHDGKIWVESDGEGEGNGATFSFCIPV